MDTTGIHDNADTDAALIASAKVLHEAIGSHLRRAAEDFWRLGEILDALFKRRGPGIRWADVLAEIGINRTTANHAIRLHTSTSLDDLSGYKNKTAALRALGILSAASPTDRDEPGLDGGVQPSDTARTGTQVVGDEPAPAAPDGDRESSRPDRSTTPIHREKIPHAVERSAPATRAEAHPAPGSPEAHEEPSPLATLAKIATALEHLTEEVFPISAEVLAQVDRADDALALIRRKGAAHAAA